MVGLTSSRFVKKSVKPNKPLMVAGMLECSNWLLANGPALGAWITEPCWTHGLISIAGTLRPSLLKSKGPTPSLPRGVPSHELLLRASRHSISLIANRRHSEARAVRVRSRLLLVQRNLSSLHYCNIHDT